MRIITLADYGGPYPGSFIPMLRAARRAAEARGWHVESRFGAGAGDRPWLAALRAEGHDAVADDTRGLRARSALVRERLRAAPGPAIVHTHFSGWDVPAVLAAAGRDDAHVIWHLHSRLGDAPRLQVTNRARFAVAGRGTALILCAGPEIEAKARARWAPRRRLELLPNGIDTSSFAPPTDAERAAARRAVGHDGDDPLLLHFGWDWATKGGDLLLAAVAELRRRGRPVRAVTVGAPAEARAAIAREGLDGAVRVIEPRDDVAALFAAADAFVAVSAAEGLPYAVLEALSSATPVIASDIPAHRAIAASAPGCRLAPREPAALAAAIAAVLADQRAERDRLVRARTELVEAYDLAGWSERLMELYARVAAG